MPGMDHLEPIVEPATPEPAGSRGLDDVLLVVRTVLLGVLAIALVVIAIQLSRSARADEQRRCLERADVVARTPRSGGSPNGMLQRHRDEMLRCVGLNPAPMGADEAVPHQAVVPDVTGKALGEAEQILGAWGFQASPHLGDPQGPDAIVAAQEPGAGLIVPRGAVVGLRTRVDARERGDLDR